MASFWERAQNVFSPAGGRAAAAPGGGGTPAPPGGGGAPAAPGGAPAAGPTNSTAGPQGPHTGAPPTALAYGHRLYGAHLGNGPPNILGERNRMTLTRHLQIDRGDPLSLGTAVNMLGFCARSYMLKDRGFLYPDNHRGGVSTTYLSEEFVLRNFQAVLKINLGDLEGYRSEPALLYGPKYRTITIHVSIGNDAFSVSVTPPRSSDKPDFSNGLPLYLWITRDGKVPRLDRSSEGASNSSGTAAQGGAGAPPPGAQASTRRQNNCKPPEILIRVKCGKKELLRGTMRLPDNWYTTPDATRSRVALHNSYPRMSKRQAALPVEVCVLRLRPTGTKRPEFQNNAAMANRKFINVAAGHVNVRPVHYTRAGFRESLNPSNTQARTPAPAQQPQPAQTPGKSPTKPQKSINLEEALKALKENIRNMGKKKKAKPAAAAAPAHVNSPGSAIVAGAMNEDIEPVQVVMGDYKSFRPIGAAFENFARLFAGEFLTVPARVGQASEPVAFIENRNWRTQVLISQNPYDKKLVIAFQGTKELRDYIQSLRALPTNGDVMPVSRHQYRIANARGDPIYTSRQPGFMNPGFKACWQSVEAAVFDVVDRITQDDPWWTIYTTGHSLGGALSTVAAEALATRHPECAPRVEKLEL